MKEKSIATWLRAAKDNPHKCIEPRHVRPAMLAYYRRIKGERRKAA